MHLQPAKPLPQAAAADCIPSQHHNDYGAINDALPTGGFRVVLFLSLTLWWSLLLSMRNDPKPNSHGGDRKATPTDIDNARDIVEQMEKGHKDCVVFFGSQTGTAEGYVSRLAKEGKARFGLETRVVNLEDYDLHNLDAFPRDKIVIFAMSTYGEGEPPDSAVGCFDLLTGDDRASAASGSLSSLTYVAFGLGNKTYE
jgi:sulfite reductase alpha subunit-like flavoprotein